MKLTPYLFAVYINDVDLFCIGCHVIMYADDIILIASSITELENLLHKCEHELQWLDMSINFKNLVVWELGNVLMLNVLA